MNLDIEITMKCGTTFRRSIVSGKRELEISGMFAYDKLESDVVSAVHAMYRDMFGSVILEDADGPE